MKANRLTLGTVILVLLTVVGTTLAAGSGAAVGDDDRETLTVIFEDRQQNDVDVDGAGPTPGDYYVFAQRLENPRGKTVGNLYAKCTTHFDGMDLCEGVFKITGKGEISVQTAFRADFSEPITLAVNGGTGRYQRVSGQGNFTQFADGRFGVVFHLNSAD